MATKYVILRGTVSGAVMEALKKIASEQSEWDFWVNQVEVDEFFVSLSQPTIDEYDEGKVCDFEEFFTTVARAIE